MDELIKLIDENDTISFDIFDTLLFRNISRPSDIFRTMNEEVYKIYNLSDFCKKRIEAEQVARKSNASDETTLDEIYSQFKQYKINKPNIEKIKQMELERELEFITFNPFMKNVYDYCVKKKKKIFLISDMYLDSKFIKKLLEKAKYNINCNIYVSCECDVRKRTGELFKYVEEKEHIDKNKWLHIGDNLVSDYNTPISYGISAYHYKNVNSYETNNSKSIFESIILGIRNNEVYNDPNQNIEDSNEYFKLFGKKYIAPLYLGFTSFVYNLTYDSDNIFFLARDGYIIKNIYDLFPKAKNKHISYLYVSRNTIKVPAFYLESKDKLMTLLTSNGNAIIGRKISDFLQICKIDIDDKYMRILKNYGFNSFDDEITKDNSYSAIKAASFLLEDSKKTYEEMIENAIRYLKQEKVDSFDVPNVVDVGWMGSIQNYMSVLLNKQMKGFYFGTVKSDYKDYSSNTFGYLFDQGNKHKDEIDVRNNVMMFELIFSAPHPSTIGYKVESNGIVKPVFDDNNDSTDKIVSIFQESSIELIKKIMNYYKYYDNVSSSFSTEFYLKYIYKYDYNDILHFKKINNDIFPNNPTKYSYVYEITKNDLANNYNDVLNRIKDIKYSLWNGAFFVTDIDDYNEYIKLTSRLVIDRDRERLNELLDRYLPTLQDYINIVLEYFNNDYYDYYFKIIKIYYHKYHPTLFMKLRRKIIPYKIRKILHR